MSKYVKVAIAVFCLSTLFSATGAVLGYFSGIYFNGMVYYHWDSYWIVFGIGMACTIGCLAVVGLIFWVMDWLISN